MQFPRHPSQNQITLRNRDSYIWLHWGYNEVFDHFKENYVFFLHHTMGIVERMENWEVFAC